MKTVLVVDDEELFARAFAAGLMAHDPSLRVLSASNGVAAMRLLAANEIDLVLTDLHMPEMDGVNLVAHVARYHPRVSVVVVTAFGSPPVCERLRALGVVGLFDKPADLPAVYDRIRSVLDMPDRTLRVNAHAAASPDLPRGPNTHARQGGRRS